MLVLQGTKGPDLLAGVLCLAGEELLIGVWHLDVVELPRGVISVPISLRRTSAITSVAASFMGSQNELLNRKLSLVASECRKFWKIGSTLSVNLSAVKFCGSLQSEDRGSIGQNKKP